MTVAVSLTKNLNNFETLKILTKYLKCIPLVRILKVEGLRFTIFCLTLTRLMVELLVKAKES